MISDVPVGKERVFLFPVDEVTPHHVSQLHLHERMRAENSSPEKRKQFIAGRICVKRALHDVLETDGEDTDLEVVSDNSTPPQAPEYPSLHLSISHTKHLAAACCSKQGVGIDLEEIDDRPVRLLDRFCTDEEKASVLAEEDISLAATMMWTKKEAILKLLGKGFSLDPRTIHVRDYRTESLVLEGHVLSVAFT